MRRGVWLQKNYGKTVCCAPTGRQGQGDQHHGHADVLASASDASLGLSSVEMSASWGEAEGADRQNPLKSVENDRGCVKSRLSSTTVQRPFKPRHATASKIQGGTLERDKIAHCRYGTTFSHSLDPKQT
jgi:hypothetical protein